jgi:hypothetical protein
MGSRVSLNSPETNGSGNLTDDEDHYQQDIDDHMMAKSKLSRASMTPHISKIRRT